MSAPQLHVYQCGFCKIIATTTVRVSGQIAPIHCLRCHRILAYRWSQPIRTAEERAIAERGIVFNPFGDRSAPLMVLRCEVCRRPLDESETVELGAKYCSLECALRAEEEQLAFRQRLEKLHQEMPWLK